MNSQHPTEDTRIVAMKELMSPRQLIEEFPLTPAAEKLVLDARHSLQQILHNRNDRVFVVVGPCSIHDPKAALEYADRLKPLIDQYREQLCIVMRVYFEKPRTTVGWKGLINDPGLDNIFRLNDGLRLARQLLLDLNKRGVPAGTEYLDLISPQYIADLISWGAIGARTTESQVHRELASGISCPVGFKNGTGGDVQIAVDAVSSASRSHHFLSVTKDGHSAIFQTAGNPDCHIILRGGNRHPNYDPASILKTEELMLKGGLDPAIVVDCSHANSGKDPDRQAIVCRDVAGQIAQGSESIKGIMLESHLLSGAQKLQHDKPLTYGQSITDACMSWETTEELLAALAAAVETKREKAQAAG